MRHRLHRTALAVAAATALTLTGCATDDAAPGAGTGSPTADGSMGPDAMAEEDMAEEGMAEEGMAEEGMAEEGMDDDMSEDMAEDDMSADPMTAEAHAFTATTLDGAEFDGASLAGAPAVLWFWAPWCPTCIGQIPAVTGLAEEYEGEVPVVAVGGLDSADAISEMASEDIPHVTHLVDDAGEVWQHFGMTQQSTFVVLDDGGEIVAEGVLTESELAQHVADLAG